MQVLVNPIHYLSKAKFYLKLSLAFVIYTVTFAPIWKTTSLNEDAINLLVGLPIISTFIIIPIGFYHLIKSVKRKEPQSKSRRLYMLWYTIALFLLISLIISIIKDFDKLFGHL
jgi:hypothetical protein